MPGAPNKRLRREEKRADGEPPQKKFYRQRAHANPFSDHDLKYPATPAEMDWTAHYPSLPLAAAAHSSPVTVADVGCGFGGLLFALAQELEGECILGLEIRTSVTSFVSEKIRALRVSSDSSSASSDSANPYRNVSVLRANAMKFLPNLFVRGQLKRMFFCFPDPHFKARKHKARIVSAGLAAEYAYVLAPGIGRVYTVTDVEDLHRWMVKHFGDSPHFERVLPEEEEEEGRDVCVRVMTKETEEGKKVERNGGKKFVAVFRRREDPPWPDEETEEEGRGEGAK